MSSASYISAKIFCVILPIILFSIVSCNDPFQKPNEGAEPEINITHTPNQEIPSGGSFNFGSIAQNASIEAVFIIENKGTSDLLLTSTNPVLITGFGSDTFTVIVQPDRTIHAGGNTSLTIKFSSNGVEDTANWNKLVTDHSWSEIYSIVIDHQDNVYVAGYGSNLVNGSSGNDWWVKKYNSNGIEDTLHWNKSFDSPGSMYDGAMDIAIDGNKNVYIVGLGFKLVSDSSGMDWWIKKFNSDGIEDSINWDKKIGGNYTEYAWSVVIDGNKNVYVSGTYDNHDAWLIKKYSENGVEDVTNWDKLINQNSHTDFVHSSAVDGDSIYVVGNGYNLLNGSSVEDWLIKKYFLNGEEQ